MHHLPHLGTILGVNLPELVSVVIPLAGMALGLTVALSAMILKFQKQRLWHETARLALEKGQPLPPYPGRRGPADSDGYSERQQPDLRGGLVMIGVGVGLYIFLGAVSNGRVAMVGAIPGLIGAALVLHWLLTSLFGRGDKPQVPPPSA